MLTFYICYIKDVKFETENSTLYKNKNNSINTITNHKDKIMLQIKKQ